MRILLVSALIIVCSTTPDTSFACSAAGCLGRGIEFQRSFTIRVVHAGKPLPGVSVRIMGTSQAGVPELFFVQTSSDGTAHFSNIPTGDYWIRAELLEVSARYECFHVNRKPSLKARSKRLYEWGNEAVAFRRAAGQFLDSQPGKDGTPLQNFLHQVEVPVASAELELQQPFTDEVYKTVTDVNGGFAFDQVPNGTYVLRIKGGARPAGQSLDADGVLVEFGETAKRDTLLIVHRNAGFGSCGGTGIEFRDPQTK